MLRSLRALRAFAPPNPQASRFALPGLSLPLNWAPDSLKDCKQKLFSHALGGNVEGCAPLELTPVREFTMLQIMDSITDKPNWHQKVFDSEISKKWKGEMRQVEGHSVTQAMADWIIDELRYKAGIFKRAGAISVYNGDVVKSDSAVPLELKESLKRKVQVLENIPDIYKDYHPGSDEKVLDLVHPSLFPLIYGYTRVLKDTLIRLEDCIESIGKGEILPIPPDEHTDFINEENIYPPIGAPFSKNFQWLPCEVEFSDNGCSRITSYINNLHPREHEDLYVLIEQLIDKVIPLWNMTLTPLEATYWKFDRVPFYGGPEYNPDPEKIPDEDCPPKRDDETEGQYFNRIWEWKEEQRVVVQPDAGKFQVPSVRAEYFNPMTQELKEEMKVNLRRDYANRGLQVIVKLANIELTPEKPDYEGGSWHIEGQLNEHICATAIYYYDNSNITASRLAFRQQSFTDIWGIEYPQEERTWLKEIFNCEHDGPGVQDVGSVLCSEDRLITFPNILQHQVLPFKLVDATKPGHRKIVALFLVDPNIKIISTANVPPQRRDWWEKSMANINRPNKLSAELQEDLVNNIEHFTIGMDKAKQIRLELIEERKNYSVKQNELFEAPEFSLCEH